MTNSTRVDDKATGYGARPVSVDIARGRTLTEARHSGANQPPAPSPLPLTDQVIADRLSLAHWPRGHQVIVCSLAGGTGRTTVAGLIATVLTQLPYAHIWHPIGLVDLAPRRLGRTRERWDVVTTDREPGDTSNCTQSGAWVLAGSTSARTRQDFSVVVVDAPADLPSDLETVESDQRSSVVLLTRPDRRSLCESAEALVWMNDRLLVNRRRVTTVINYGVGRPDRGSRAAAVALGIRSAAIHSLPADPMLGPGRVLPSGHDLPARLRRPIAHLCLDIWSQTKSPIAPTALSSLNQQENA